MTQQEQQLLDGLIERVSKTEVQNKDAAADRLIKDALGTSADALYILCQTVLVQQFAMENAQRQLADAQAEVSRLKAAKPEEHGSFLGNLFGLGKNEQEEPRPAQPQSQVASPQQSAGGYAPVNSPGYAPTGYPPASYQQAGYPPAGYPPPQPGYGYGTPAGGLFGGGGGFLQGAMQTAAGVVAGEFAFRALEDVFRGFGGGGHGFAGGDTEVVNNYYGNDQADSSGGFGDRLRDADGLGNGISPDIEDRRGDAQGFFASADDSNGDVDGFADSDSSNTYDDGGSGFDDGGSNDDSF